MLKGLRDTIEHDHSQERIDLLHMLIEQSERISKNSTLNNNLTTTCQKFESNFIETEHSLQKLTDQQNENKVSSSRVTSSFEFSEHK